MMISILIPIYNVEKYIERCARSLFDQTYSDIEYIFVDDCSPDKSIEILEKTLVEYPHKKKYVRIIRHEENRGLAAARNTAVANCSGDFVMHVDSDDFLEKNAVELLVDRQIETEADIVSGCAVMETKNGQKVLREPNYKSKEEMILRCIKPTNDHFIWRRIIKLSLYKENHIAAKEGVNVGEDWQVLPQLVYFADKITKIDEVIYHYNRMNDNSYMAQNTETKLNVNIAKQNIESILILKSFFDNKEPQYKKAITKTCLCFFHQLMDKCVVYKDKIFYSFLCNYLNNDKESFCRNYIQKMIDNNYHIYKIDYYMRYIKNGIDYKCKLFLSHMKIFQFMNSHRTFEV